MPADATSLRRKLVDLLPRRSRHRYVLVGGLAAVVAGSVVAMLLSGAAARPVLRGDEVPADQVPAIARASLACPTLTAPRLAGQLMVASRFRVDATTDDGGSGVAGLTDAQWQRWVPWQGAVRHDPAAEISALAHLMCDLVGQLRQSDLSGDLWELALGAYRSSVDAVREHRDVPEEAEDYVSTVVGYAAWYSDHAALTSASESATPGPAPTGGAAPAPVPADLVPLVVDAGKQCAQVTPARIAGQLMAASAFDPNLLSAAGGQGIAQFQPSMWSRYARPGQSPWDPQAAIPTLATAMCSLSSTLVGLTGDPYPVALASFHDGPQAVAGGGERSEGDRFADRVLAYAAFYVRDPRLALVLTSASVPVGSPGRSPALHPGPGVASRRPPTVTPTRTAAASSPAPGVTSGGAEGGNTAAANPSFAVKTLDGLCLEMPQAVDGVALTIARCDGGAGQKWTFNSDGSMRSHGYCLDLAWAAQEDGTRVQSATCNGGWAQRFYVNSANDLVNSDIGKCIRPVGGASVSGALLELWSCDGSDPQKWLKRG